MAAQAGLRVAQFGTDQHLHQLARQEIAETAAQRHFGVEGAASQDERIGCFAQGRLHACDVLGMMLSIGVGGDDSEEAGERGECVSDAGLERRAFAEVDRVAQYLHAGELRRLVEDGAELRPAAVVHQQDGGHAAAGQVAHTGLGDGRTAGTRE